MNFKPVHGAIFGLVVGDALGVPAEFKSREELSKNPVTRMTGYGTHNQPAGTWSDDSSLMLCLAEVLTDCYDLNKIARNFIKWYYENYWTPHGKVFDAGIATSDSIRRLKEGVNPLLAGGSGERDNGNGSLMRILPLIFYIKVMPVEQRFNYILHVSSITHRHIRSVIACFIYCEYALLLLKGEDKRHAYDLMLVTVMDFLNNNAICPESEIKNFCRLLPVEKRGFKPIYGYNEDEIYSSGYVIHSLEAAIWCLFTNRTYEDTVLSAVNLGSDTDTTAAIVGGLAGILYGYDAIPKNWIDTLARKHDIIHLCDKLSGKFI